MNSIKDIIDKYKESKDKKINENQAISERHELIEKFAKKINENRLRDKLKPLQNSYINMKLAQSGLKSNGDLYWFYRYCEDAKNFDKCFWWSLKAR
jgi:hypothetical protein